MTGDDDDRRRRDESDRSRGERDRTRDERDRRRPPEGRGDSWDEITNASLRALRAARAADEAADKLEREAREREREGISRDIAIDLDRRRTSTPPALRWLQRWWWRVSLATAAEILGHVLHEAIRNGWLK